MKVAVYIRPKPGILDPQGEAVLGALRHLGFDVDAVRIGRVVDLELNVSDSSRVRPEVERMCEELLANPMVESFEIEIVE